MQKIKHARRKQAKRNSFAKSKLEPPVSKTPLRDKLLQFRRGEKINNYAILDKPTRSGSKYLTPLGQGGSGTVFLASQMLHANVSIKRAIKFFVYHDDIAGKTINRKGGPISHKDFLNEIVNIAGFNHENLVKVTDAGIHRKNGVNIPFIVYEYIKGPDLKEVVNKDGNDQSITHHASVIRKRFSEKPEEILKVLIQIASGLKCLHDQEFAHCDMAPKNILLKMEEDYKPVIGDLGVGRSLKGSGKVLILGSVLYMPSEVRKYLYKEIPKSKLRTLQPQWDLYGFAKIGMELIELLPADQNLSWNEPLKDTLLECMDGARKRNISALLERLQWLLPINRVTANVPELSPSLAKNRKNLMPVEALMTTDRVRELIRHPALLRLAKVPQITMAYQVFPGAGHSRYEHSLGTMETMRRYLINLVDQGDFLAHLSSDKIETALVCALLSSITRFPLANIFVEIKGMPDKFMAEFSKDRILSEVFQIKNNAGLTLPQLIKKNFPSVSIECVTNILVGNKTLFEKEDELIYSLLNCSLDVRVVDFVRRDSLHLGITKEAFNLEELLSHLTIRHHRLALKITGVSVAEEIITLRYNLFNRIYWNRPNRAFVAMIRHLILQLASTEFFDDLRKIIIKTSEPELLGYLTVKAVASNREDLYNLACLLETPEQELFRVILELSPKENSDLSIVCQRIGEMDSLEILQLANNIATEISSILPLDKDPKTRVPVIVDIPSEPGSGNKLGDDILVVSRGKGPPTTSDNLSHISGIVKGVNDSFNDYLRRMRVFLHPKCYPENKKQREILQKRIEDYLLKCVA